MLVAYIVCGFLLLVFAMWLAGNRAIKKDCARLNRLAFANSCHTSGCVPRHRKIEWVGDKYPHWYRENGTRVHLDSEWAAWNDDLKEV